MLRWLRRALIGVLVLLVLATLGVFAFSRTLPRDDLAVIEPGSLTVSDTAMGSFRTGSITVSVGDRVTLTSGRTVLWESPEDQAFLSAGTGEVDTEEHRGYFWPEVEHDEQWRDQRITSTEIDGMSIRLAGDLDGHDWQVTISQRDGGGAVFAAEVDGADVVALQSGRDQQGVHGFGEQFDDFDLDDRLVPILVREQGVGRGEQPLTLLADLTNRSAGGDHSSTYAAMATFVTDDLRGVALDPEQPESHAFAVADTRDDDRVGLEVWAPRLTAELTSGDTPARLLTQRAEPASTLPAWTQRGAIVGIQGGTEEVRRRVSELRDAGVELAGVWLQDWSGQRTTSFGDRLWWTWQLDEERYPDWAELVGELNEQGIEVTTYVNPFLVDAAPKKDPGIRNLFAEASERGFLVRNDDGETYLLDQGGFDAALVDLSDGGARRWYAEVIADEVLGAGASGFMADFGEGLPFDAVVRNGHAEQLHNQWPALWAETVREACRIAEQSDCLTWFRSGSLGMGPVLAWNGDQVVDLGADDGLASALLGTFSAGVSGWPLIHSDLGGYTSINAVVKDYVRSPELLRRWAEYAAFGVLMRTHEGNRPDANRQVFDPSEREQFGRMTKVFAALAPYRQQVLAEAADSGLPALRHGWLVAPGSDAAEVDSQFFLGNDLLVAPVLEEGAREVDVVFPPGQWRHLFTGKEYAEGRRSVPAPLGQPAAFVRAGSRGADQLDLSDLR